MPYYFDEESMLSDGVERWEMLQDIWDIIDVDLTGVRFETREEAISKRYRKSLDPGDYRMDSLFVARYRETDDRENLLNFYEMGLVALEHTKTGIKNRKIDNNFLYHWSILTSCHGFVCAAMMARGDDMQNRRAGAAGRAVTNVEPQQQWYSHYYLRERPNCKNREEVEDRIERLVNAITDGAIAEIESEHLPWFDRFLSLDTKIKTGNGKTLPNPRYGKLTKSFHKDTPSIKKMKQLIKLPVDGLPPLDLKIPPP